MLIASDDFLRADGNLIGSTTPVGGGTWAYWTTGSGTAWTIVSQEAVATWNGTDTWASGAVVDVGAATSVRIGVDVDSPGAARVIGQYSSTTDYVYAQIQDWFGSYRVSVGTASRGGAAYVNVGTRAGRLELLIKGDQLTALWDGTAIVSFTDPEPSTGTKAGIGGLGSFGNYGMHTGPYDNFTVDLVVTPLLAEVSISPVDIITTHVCKPAPVGLALTPGAASAKVVQAVSPAPVTLFLGVAAARATIPLSPATILVPIKVPGPAGAGAPVGVIHPAPILVPVTVPGPVAPPNPVLTRPLTPMPIEVPIRVPGPWILPAPPTDPRVPTIEVGGTFIDARFAVIGASNVTDGVCQPQLNALSTGRYTAKMAPPDPDSGSGFTVAGRRILTGYVSTVTNREVDPGEDASQLVTVEVEGTLRKWDELVVLPDFGSQNPDRLGTPIQDTRYFDWTMNGIGNEWFGEEAANLIPSQSIDVIEADEEKWFPLPDVFPDVDARWMWVTNPRGPQPRGWCHFRVPTPVSPLDSGIQKVQFWAAAFDYAEVWVDGVKILTCDKPGVAEHLEVDLTRHYHLVTIKAYNAGGKAGVLFSMIPVGADGMYEAPVMNSRDGWKSLAYPKRTFISTPGQVLNRLRYEAAKRGAAGIAGWSFGFTDLTDSAGRPWPRDGVIPLDVGMSYLDVLLRLAEDLIDFAEHPSGRRLDAWIKDQGTGRNVPEPWTHTVDLNSRGTVVKSR